MIFHSCQFFYLLCCIHQRAQCCPLLGKIEQIILRLPFFIPPLFLSPTLFLGSEIYSCNHPELFFAPIFCLIPQCLLGITYVLTIFFLCIWELCFIMFFAWIAFWPPIFMSLYHQSNGEHREVKKNNERYPSLDPSSLISRTSIKLSCISLVIINASSWFF